MSSLEKEYLLREEQKQREEEEGTVVEVRIVYKSGMYVQTWFKKFAIGQDMDTGEIESVEYELTPRDPNYPLIQPLALNPRAIESVWFVQSKTLAEFRKATTPKV